MERTIPPQQTEVMFELLRAAVFDRTPVLPTNTHVDWDSLMDQASEQGILAWVYDSIGRLPQEQRPSRIEYINFGLSAQEIWTRYDRQEKLLNYLLEVCRQHNMRLLLLKGISLAQLYPKPQSRPCGDLDIYLFEDYEKFNQLFADKLDPNQPTIQHDRHLYFDDVLVENHNNFYDPTTPQRKRIIEFLYSTLDDARLTPYGYYTLNPIGDFIFITSHTMKHFYNDNFIAMRSVTDFAMFLNTYRNQLPPKECFQVLDRLDMSHGFEVLMLSAKLLLGIDFEEYNRGLLSSKYVAYITQWVTGNNHKRHDTDYTGQGLIAYLKAAGEINHNRRICNRYMLKKEGSSLHERIDQAKLKAFILTRALLRISPEEHLKDRLRKITHLR